MVTFLIIAACLAVLVKSADIFVDQASALAKKLGLSDFLIGFTVVAFGTSLPELISTLFSAIEKQNELVMSNIVGSNITNLCLILGIAAIIKEYRIKKRDVDINVPLNLAALMAFWAVTVSSGLIITWQYGISMILVFVVLLILSKDYNHFESSSKKYKEYKPWLMLIALAALIGSGRYCIEEIITLSKQAQISETILGYFLLAIGTSLPELMTTLVAVRKNEGELGVGNILGSNLFNLLFILGVSSFVNPVDTKSFVSDLVYLSGATLAVYVFSIIGKKYSFSKKEGIGLLIIYGLFLVTQLLK